MTRDELVERLRGLGDIGCGEARSAAVYFSHTSGRVSLYSARKFYDEAVALALLAARAVEDDRPRSRPAESRPAESRPAESRPAESRPVEQRRPRPAGGRPSE